MDTWTETAEEICLQNQLLNTVEDGTGLEVEAKEDNFDKVEACLRDDGMPVNTNISVMTVNGNKHELEVKANGEVSHHFHDPDMANRIKPKSDRELDSVVWCYLVESSLLVLYVRTVSGGTFVFEINADCDETDDAVTTSVVNDNKGDAFRPVTPNSRRGFEIVQMEMVVTTVSGTIVTVQVVSSKTKDKVQVGLERREGLPNLNSLPKEFFESFKLQISVESVTGNVTTLKVENLNGDESFSEENLK